MNIFLNIADTCKTTEERKKSVKLFRSNISYNKEENSEWEWEIFYCKVWKVTKGYKIYKEKLKTWVVNFKRRKIVLSIIEVKSNKE